MVWSLGAAVVGAVLGSSSVDAAAVSCGAACQSDDQMRRLRSVSPRAVLEAKSAAFVKVPAAAAAVRAVDDGVGGAAEGAAPFLAVDGLLSGMPSARDEPPPRRTRAAGDWDASDVATSWSPPRRSELAWRRWWCPPRMLRGEDTAL